MDRKYIASLAGSWLIGLAPVMAEFYIEARQRIYLEEGLDNTPRPTLLDVHRAGVASLLGLTGFMLLRPNERRRTREATRDYAALEA